MEIDQRPIGVFDSGIGGLTVLKKLLERFPNEDFIFLGDTARLPYGSKSPETIKSYLNQNILFLKKRGVKAVVVACNTASTVLESSTLFDIPIYGVIKPGAQRALSLTKTFRIGVLGTRATIASSAYPNEIHLVSEKAQVFQQASPLLVPLVEEGWLDDSVTEIVVRRYLGPLLKEKIDTLILGCTHYPTLMKVFQKIAGDDLNFVESASTLSFFLENEFSSGKIIASNSPKGRTQLLVSDNAATFSQVAKVIIPFIDTSTIEMIDIY